MKIENLTETLILLVDESDHCRHEIVPIILHGAPVNSKLARSLLLPENPKDDVKK